MIKDKPKIYTLDNDITEDLFFEQSVIIGIVAPIKEFKFCWMVNNYTALRFKKCLDQEHCLSKNGRLYTFSIYQSSDPFQLFDHTIYANHYDGEFLLPELRNFDFIWIIKNIGSETYNGHDVVQLLRSMHCVNMCSTVNINLIENKNRLIL